MAAKRLKLKVCGMREEGNIQQLLDLNPEYLGLIFYPPSPRYVSEPLSIDLTIYSTQLVGVFVNATLDDIAEKVKEYGLSVAQLHGDESPEFCASVKSSGLEVWKVFAVGDNFSFDMLEPYEAVVDAFLFDTASKRRGGTGKVFDWEILKQYPYQTPFYLSGGLNGENIQQAASLELECLIGLDLNSGFELSPGLKNVVELTKAFEKIRKYKR